MESYELKDYIKVLEDAGLICKTYKIEELLKKEIKSITYNSKEVNEDTLFICKGLNFKEEYLIEALEKGAILYISEKEYKDYPHIIVSNIRKSLALLSSLFYENPAEYINMIGITGTKGKSTTAFYTKSIFDEYFGDTAILSSIENYDGRERTEALVTTPESLEIERHIRNAVDAKIKNLVMEVSSQALKYDRVYKIPYKIGVFTNISIDHISPIEHPNFEDYFHSKLKLLKESEIACINLDADYIDEIRSAAKNCSKTITYSRKNRNADIYGYDIRKQKDSYIFKVKTKRFNEEFILPMLGIFNIENALASIAIAYALEIPPEYIREGLKKVQVSGRMETYLSPDEKTIAIVDYAHNKLSFESLLTSIKEEYPNKRIITVFGCPGSKAQNRRKDMGEIANTYADFTYLTTDDPGLEEPLEICNEIAKFISYNKYKIVLDRETAIKEAILSFPNAVIVVAGKGSETHQKTKVLEDYIGDKACILKAYGKTKELIRV